MNEIHQTVGQFSVVGYTIFLNLWWPACLRHMCVDSNVVFFLVPLLVVTSEKKNKCGTPAATSQ